jgi:hypothetical protein
MKTSKDEDMVNAGLLKFHCAVVFHKAAIAQEHGTRQRSVIGPRGEQVIESDKKSPAQPSQPFRNCKAGMLDDGEKLRVAKRGLQMSALQRQITAKIKAAGLPKFRTGRARARTSTRSPALAIGADAAFVSFL